VRQVQIRSSSPDPTRTTFAGPRRPVRGCSDKGLDRVFVFRLDTTSGKLRPTEQGSVQSKAGAGPRHAAFHPHAPYVYVINELDSTVATYQFHAASGQLSEIQVTTSLPADFKERSTGAEIAVAPSGRFVYASNRGHDSIVIFAVDPKRRTANDRWLGADPGPPTAPLRPRSVRQLPVRRQSGQRQHYHVCVDTASGTLKSTGQWCARAAP